MEPLWPTGKLVSEAKLKDLKSMLHLIPQDSYDFYVKLVGQDDIEDDLEASKGGGGARERTNLLTPQPSRETLRASGIAGRSPATVSAGLRTASKGSSPPEQNQTRAYGA
ncbi:hypothetical protein SFRURICE_014779 [Spodoptera frugiperda]|nr:hypothetical protein SFRURICE_014779 [Spodoptera frugiperda]